MTSTASAASDTVADPNALLTDGSQLIGGEWVPAAGGETIDVINPATGELLLRVPRSGAADVDAAVRAAADAFPAWRDTSPVVRAGLLRRWADLCREHAQDIEILERMEVGHPRWGPSPVPSVIEFPAGLADKITGQTLPTASPDVLGMTIREPFGVCGSIIPWNVPGPIMVTDVAPAIAVGNTIVVKPAEDAPLTCLLLAKLVRAERVRVDLGRGPRRAAGPADPGRTGDHQRVRFARGHRAPWGGYKHSGFGRTMSAESVLDYTQIKTVVINA